MVRESGAFAKVALTRGSFRGFLFIVFTLASMCGEATPLYRFDTQFRAALPPDGSSASLISNTGIVAGSVSSMIPDGSYPPKTFTYSRSAELAWIGSLGGGYEYPTAINSSGTVVGRAIRAGNSGYDAGFIYSAATGIKDLGHVMGTTLDVSPNDINDSGNIVGTHFGNGSVNYGGFLYRPGESMTDLGNFFPAAINSHDEIVGTMASLATILTPGGAYQALGHLGAGWSTATDVNDRGQIIGESDIVRHQECSPICFAYRHAFLFDPSAGMIDIAPQYDFVFPTSLNNRGEVVGFFSPAPRAPAFGFIYSEEYGFHLLKDLVAGLPGPDVELLPSAINDHGDIVGFASDGLPFLISSISVPEPGSAALLIAGFIAFSATRRKGHH